MSEPKVVHEWPVVIGRGEFSWEATAKMYEGGTAYAFVAGKPHDLPRYCIPRELARLASELAETREELAKDSTWKPLYETLRTAYEAAETSHKVEVNRLRKALSEMEAIVQAAGRVAQERDRLRDELDWISAETQEPAIRDRARAALSQEEADE